MKQVSRLTRVLDTFVNAYSAMQSHPPPSKTDVRSVQHWFLTHPNAIAPEESAYISHAHDLLAIRPKSKSPLRLYLERTMFRANFFPKFIQRLPAEGVADDGQTFWFDDEKFERVAGVLVGVVGLSMFIAPFWALQGFSDGAAYEKLGCITGFVVGFYGMVALGTTARAHESLGAAAA